MVEAVITLLPLPDGIICWIAHSLGGEGEMGGAGQKDEFAILLIRVRSDIGLSEAMGGHVREDRCVYAKCLWYSR